METSLVRTETGLGSLHADLADRPGLRCTTGTQFGLKPPGEISAHKPRARNPRKPDLPGFLPLCRSGDAYVSPLLHSEERETN